jgi:hypothetical protein
MKAYTLTPDEARVVLDGDDAQVAVLDRSLRQRFGRPAGGMPVDTEVRHPDGWVYEQYTRRS